MIATVASEVTWDSMGKINPKANQKSTQANWNQITTPVKPTYMKLIWIQNTSAK